jgi:flagellar motor protein MotB
MNPRQNQEKKPSSGDPVENGQVTALLAQAALSQATELARIGRYDEAERALGVNPALDSSPVLDLLARIRAQQGRLAEAQALWSEAVRLDPNNESYRAALRRLARMNRYSFLGGVSRWLAGAALAVLALAAFSWMAQRWWQHERRTLISEVRTAVQQARAVNAPELTVKLEGVSERVEAGDLVLRFDEGLFKDTDVLTPHAKNLLAALGKQLQPLAGKSAIRIVGYSDDLPVRLQVHFRDNHFLALARANAAARFLASSAGIPERQFTLQSAEGSIYPNDTPENRARNRSVEIRISSRPD